MTPSPRVAIGVPVYNGEDHIARTLDDFSAQTFGDFDLVVCDNVSTDGTEGIVRDRAARDPRIRFVRNVTNIGSLPNFNRAFEIAAPAPYFAWAAHDDIHAPDFLERLVAALDGAPDAVLAYGRSACVDGEGLPLPYETDRNAFIGRDGTPNVNDRALEGGVAGTPGARFARVLLSSMQNPLIYGLFRRSALEQTSLHQFYGTDTLLLAEAALVGPFAYVDAEVFAWRFHRGGTSFMTREEWVARETGDDAFEAGLPVRALPRYVGAISRATLRPADCVRAYGALARHFVKPERIRRLALPGPHNYFGFRRWPWESEPHTEPRVAR